MMVVLLFIFATIFVSNINARSLAITSLFMQEDERRNKKGSAFKKFNNSLHNILDYVSLVTI